MLIKPRGYELGMSIGLVHLQKVRNNTLVAELTKN
ncbi:hypothetical protein NIES4103_06100 [Nostoc sp. NIES-4103]|nr:hypothetical protein NIES4103_06100 [Nostoc sp. NIES-4103]